MPKPTGWHFQPDKDFFGPAEFTLVATDGEATVDLPVKLDVGLPKDELAFVIATSQKPIVRGRAVSFEVKGLFKSPAIVTWNFGDKKPVKASTRLKHPRPVSFRFVKDGHIHRQRHDLRHEEDGRCDSPGATGRSHRAEMEERAPAASPYERAFPESSVRCFRSAKVSRRRPTTLSTPRTLTRQVRLCRQVQNARPQATVQPHATSRASEADRDAQAKRRRRSRTAQDHTARAHPGAQVTPGMRRPAGSRAAMANPRPGEPLPHPRNSTRRTGRHVLP